MGTITTAAPATSATEHSKRLDMATPQIGVDLSFPAQVTASSDHKFPTFDTAGNINNTQAYCQTMHLLYRMTTDEYIGSVITCNNGTCGQPRREMLEQWRAATTQFNALQQVHQAQRISSEFQELPADMQVFAQEVLSRGLTHRTYDIGLVTMALVNLDSLVVHQKHLDLDNVAQHRAVLRERPDAQHQFALCFPDGNRVVRPNVTTTWTGPNSAMFMYTSPSNDLRTLGLSALSCLDVDASVARGDMSGFAGAAVGYTANYLSAVQVDDRLILLNGTHRAAVLRTLGILKVPCLIQKVQDMDELRLVLGATSDVLQNPGLFLQAPRPPLFCDYFDPDLAAIINMPRRLKRLSVSVQVIEDYVPASI
jgi:hypothetical protein